MRIKKGDQVLIISGKDRKKRGKVLRAFPTDFKVIIEGINIRKKAAKPKSGGQKGQIVQKPAPIDVSDVKLLCPKCGKAARTGYRLAEGKKYRICKKCKQEI